MKIYAISDLHLTNGTDKPMDIFGESWVGHWQKIIEDWDAKVTSDDIVLIAGDISWAMNIPQAKTDLTEISSRPGKKIIIRGNHDYWWSTYKKICELDLPDTYFIQNNAIKLGDYVFCGTRGWTVSENGQQQQEEDKKIFDRELIRLRMALTSAAKLASNGEEIIGLIHYPPFNSHFEDSEFTKMFSEFDVKRVIYGHLHGAQARYKEIVNKHGTNYFLTSCDFLGNRLIEI